MHDRLGRAIQEGDFVKANRVCGEFRPPFIVGRAHSLNCIADSCNLQVKYPVFGGIDNTYATAKQVEIVAKFDGDEPQ